ncbi:uncharacterized protein [Nicotiana tomentosiformis]|uniref:uncharacterized protein n=1 Tax=Nicotiana tomentosiformis TaxID=4098 RepID=UPI00388CB9D8
MAAQSSEHSQGNKGPHQQGQPDKRFQQRRVPCPKCGRMQFGSCFMDIPVCYGRGLRGHIQRECRSSYQNMGRGAAQPANSAATTSIATPARGTPAPAGDGVARGGAQNSGGPDRFYAMRRRRELETSPDVITGILTVQSHDVYAVIDPGSTLSYVTPYVAMEFGIEPEQLYAPLYVFTTLYSFFAKIDYRTRTVRFEYPNEPVIEMKGDDVVPNGRFISYLKDTKMINKGCIYHLVRVMDTDAEAPTLESVPVVNEFPRVFPDKPLGIPLDRDIYFGIDEMPDTYTISIPPYRMAPAELKELKE